MIILKKREAIVFVLNVSLNNEYDIIENTITPIPNPKNLLGQSIPLK